MSCASSPVTLRCTLQQRVAMLVFCVSALQVSASEQALTVAISLDIPPYVMNQAGDGLELDIVREALPAYSVHFIQRPYGELQNAVSAGKADASVGVRAADDAVFYSDNFITFANYAISKEADNFTIKRIEDLKDHSVLTWQGAWRVLGDAFISLFGPGGLARDNYMEVADQAEQVRLFWRGRSDVIVIDRSIFNHFSKQQGQSLSEARLHPVFPPVTNYRVAFRNAAVRDQFNQGVRALCDSGRYTALLNRYEVSLEQSICRH